MVAIAAFATLLILAALGALVFTIRVMTNEFRLQAEKAELAHLASANREQMAYMTAVSQIHGIVESAFDHLQSKSAVEAAQVAHVRAESQVAVRNLQDELAKAKKVKAAEPVKIRARDGQEYSRDEIEIA